MNRLLLFLLLWPLLLAPPAAAQEKPPPAARLPAAFRPGAAATFDQEPRGERLAGTVTWRVLRGETENTVFLVREFATADLGPLTWRDRLTAVLDTETRAVLSFRYEIGGREGPLRLYTRLGPHPDRKGEWLHERFKIREEGEPRAVRRTVKVKGSWAPDLLEPFLASLLRPVRETPSVLSLVGVERGGLSRTPAEYRLLGEGKMELGGVSVPCRILHRRRGEDAQTVYYRTADGMVLKHGPAGLALRPAAAATEEKEEEEEEEEQEEEEE